MNDLKQYQPGEVLRTNAYGRPLTKQLKTMENNTNLEEQISPIEKEFRMLQEDLITLEEAIKDLITNLEPVMIEGGDLEPDHEKIKDNERSGVEVRLEGFRSRVERIGRIVSYTKRNLRL